MIRAFYTASSGLVAQTIKQDITANNIANAANPGFKRERVAVSSFADALSEQFGAAGLAEGPDYPRESAQGGRVYASSVADDSPGPLRDTGNDLDFAIEGPGTFEASGSESSRALRSGSFRVDASGELCTSDGAKVMGENGPIRIPQGKWSVSADGAVISDGQEVDKIKINGSVEGKTAVRQGCLEGSNVNVVKEMVSMIANMRAFEANQKMIASVDQTLEKLINDAGKV